MTSGTCPMCERENRDLCVSHFMPRSLYPLFTADGYEPVSFSSESIYPTSKQTQYPLLCFDCEQTLNTEGETWVVPLLARHNGPFLLRDLLMKQSPIYQDGERALYAAANNLEIDVPKLIHFAVGIFYKAATHSWKKDVTEPWINLGADTDALRLFLLGKADLPKHVCLSITVDSSTTVWPAMVEPYRTSSADYRTYLFYVPGLVAQLMIGDGVQTAFECNCINANPQCPILLEDVSKIMRNATREVVAGARQTEKLVRTTSEIEAKGLNVKLGD